MARGTPAGEVARDIYRYWHLPPAHGAFAALVASLERVGRIEATPRRELGGLDAMLVRDGGQLVVLVARDVRGWRRHLLIAHELAEDWLRREHHDGVETDCDAVAIELVSPTWVPGVQMRLALGA